MMRIPHYATASGILAVVLASVLFTVAPASAQQAAPLTPPMLAELFENLNLDPSLNGIFRPIFNNSTNNPNSPYAVGEPGLLPPELIAAALLTILVGATPGDFELANQVCPRFDDDRKFGLDLLVLGQIGYQDFFRSQSILTTGGNGVHGTDSAETPGQCTTSYLWHQSIKEGMAALPQLQVNDNIFRGNELGLFRLNDRTFEYCLELLPDSEWEFCKIALGMPNADHENLRPVMDLLWGDGNAPGSMFATTGSKWSKQNFVDSASLYLQGKTTLKLPGDATYWTIKELHQQTLGIDLSEPQVLAFQSLRGISLLLAILPEALVDQVASQFGTTVDDVNNGKKYFVSLYSTVLPSILPQVPDLATDSVKRTKASIVVLDAFIFAGGASVPVTIKNGLAAYYKGLTPPSSNNHSVKRTFSMTNPGDLGILALETIRSYPPVLGFPYIDVITGQRSAPLPGMAGYDRHVYGGDADKFRIRGDLNYYHQRSLNWADAALPVDGKPFSNHVCPARSMSYSMITAFWQALDATQWCLDPNTPITKQTGPTFWSDFTIIKGDSCN